MAKVQRAERVVGFQLDTLIGSDPTYAETPGAALALDTIHQLGSTCLVLAGTPAPVAESTLQKANLEVDHTIGSLRSSPGKAAALMKSDAWAYVGNAVNDMYAARKAGIKAIGVSPDPGIRRKLWVSGADIVIHSLQEFPHAVWFRSRQKTPGLSTVFSAATDLGIGTSTLKRWLSIGSVPYATDILGQKKLPDSFIDMIRPFFNYEQPSVRQIELFHMQWRIDHGTFQDSRLARKEANALRAQGELYDTQQVAQRVGYEFHTVFNWFHRGFLPGIKVGGQYLFSVREVERIKSLMDSCTTNEAANQLGRSTMAILMLTAGGKLTAHHTPNGLRFEPEEIARYRQRREQREAIKDTTWNTVRVRQELGLSQGALNRWCNAGLLEFQMISGRRQFDPVSVEKLKVKISSWNAGFEWLGPSGTAATSAPKQVAKSFSVNPDTVVEWAKAGILPFYNRRPTALKGSSYHFPTDYIRALLAYAGGVRVSQRLAVEFSKLCKEAEKIVVPEE